PFEAETANQIVHAVDTPQERAFAAAGRPNEGGDAVFLDRELGVAHRFEIAVVKRVQLNIDYGGMAIGRAVGRLHFDGFWIGGHIGTHEISPSMALSAWLNQGRCVRAVQIWAAILANSTKTTRTSDAAQATWI